MTPDMPARQQTWHATWHRARRYVATQAHNPDDARLLLDALGMLGDCPDYLSIGLAPTPKGSRSTGGWDGLGWTQ